MRSSRAFGVLLALTLACMLAPGVAGAHRTKVISALAQGHPWRNGVVPRRAAHRASALSSSNDLSYGGGIDGVGVTDKAPRVYVVFWGSQWGTQSTNSSGYDTYSGDPMGMAQDLQAFFKGLGTNGEKWSGVMTQYCQGVATGAQSCPTSSKQHVGYPTGGALAGVWEDTASAAPSQASAHQIGVEAVRAANHFAATIGVTNAFSTENQYFIVSPTGTDPDGFNTPSGQFCAWHDYTGDSTLDGGGSVSSPNGPVAFTNMPYVTDAGSACGEDFVNSGSAGTLDGVTIVGGHEYAETITDEFPAGGWLDSSGNEAADKCAWILPGSGQGAAQDITLGTGKFAVQSIWANDFDGGTGGCEVSHAIITNGSSVTNPIKNGGFELGSLADWTTSGTGGAEAVVSTGTTYPCHGGDYCALLGSASPTNGSSNIDQIFTAPTGSSSLTFYYDAICPGTVQDDWATATLKDVTAGTTTKILPNTCAADSGWVKVSHPVTPGHEYVLWLTSHDGDAPGASAYALFDDVSVQ